MSWRCDVCQKGPLVGHNVSHSNRKTKKRTMPNLQKVRVLVGNKPTRLKICTSCLKKGTFTRVVS